MDDEYDDPRPLIVIAARTWNVALMRNELAAGADPWPRVFPVLLRAGATIPPDTQDPYLLKVRSAGGWGRYERACRARLAKILARVVFPRLPTDTVSHIVHFAFHTGYY